MNTQYRDLRKAEILELSQNALHGRVRRQRMMRVAVGVVGVGGVCAVLVVTAIAVSSRSQMKPVPEPIAQDQPNIAPVLPVQVRSPQVAEPSWVLHTSPVRSDQIIRTPKTFIADIATDEELMECLVEVGEPGVVRAKGRVFSSMELTPREAEHNSGPESKLTPAKDSASGRQIAAL